MLWDTCYGLFWKVCWNVLMRGVRNEIVCMEVLMCELTVTVRILRKNVIELPFDCTIDEPTGSNLSRSHQPNGKAYSSRSEGPEPVNHESV